LFEKQDIIYQEKIFPKNMRKRLAVEAASSLGWHKYVTDDGDVIGIDRFGESAPGEQVMKEYGFTVENVITKAKALLQQEGRSESKND
jgi:transketolase